jgi:hypothetical protein
MRGFVLAFSQDESGVNGVNGRQHVSAWVVQRPYNNQRTNRMDSRRIEDSNPTDRRLVEIPTHQPDDCIVRRKRSYCNE